MEVITILNNSGITSDRKVRTDLNDKKFRSDEKRNNPVIDYLIAEGGENFYSYLKLLGIADEPNMMVLSSRHHYYYDNNDLKGVVNLINLKRLNLLRHLDSFIHTVSSASSQGCNFIGCFTDWRTREITEVPSRRYRGFINSPDCRSEIEIDRIYVSRLLEEHRFTVIDMTVISGLTYFRTENNKKKFN
jgi:hypothetical protein